MNFWHEID